MKPIKLICLLLLAVFALGAFAAATASAEEGFLPLKQKTANLLGGEWRFIDAVGTSFACPTLDASIFTFVNDKHAEGTLRLLGCKAAGLFSANSLGDKAGEILVKMLLLVCLDPKNSSGVLVDNFGVSFEIDTPLHLEVPAAGLLTLVGGLYLGAILTAGPAKLWVLEPGGVTECLEGTSKKTDTLTIEENETKKTEATNISAAGTLLQFEEEVKIEDA